MQARAKATGEARREPATAPGRVAPVDMLTLPECAGGDGELPASVQWQALAAWAGDVGERTVLLRHVLRQRGDNMLAQERGGKPPLPGF
jgi:hypothetical protein